MSKDYTKEDIDALREQAIRCGFGYIGDGGLIAFDKAVKADIKRRLEDG